MVLVGVRRLAVVDVPQKESVAGELRVVPGALTVFEQEILGSAGAILPQSGDLF